MSKPHKYEVNPILSGSLTHFEFFFWTRNGQEMVDIFFEAFLSGRY
jgi:hypothetical protein